MSSRAIEEFRMAVNRESGIPIFSSDSVTITHGVEGNLPQSPQSYGSLSEIDITIFITERSKPSFEQS